MAIVRLFAQFADRLAKKSGHCVELPGVVAKRVPRHSSSRSKREPRSLARAREMPVRLLARQRACGPGWDRWPRARPAHRGGISASISTSTQADGGCYLRSSIPTRAVHTYGACAN